VPHPLAGHAWQEPLAPQQPMGAPYAVAQLGSPVLTGVEQAWQMSALQ
jgi:hypothetical protein